MMYTTREVIERINAWEKLRYAEHAPAEWFAASDSLIKYFNTGAGEKSTCHVFRPFALASNIVELNTKGVKFSEAVNNALKEYFNNPSENISLERFNIPGKKNRVSKTITLSEEIMMKLREEQNATAVVEVAMWRKYGQPAVGREEIG